MKNQGIQHVVYGYEAEPTDLSFSKAAYWLGVLHQRFVPRFLKLAIFAYGRLEKSIVQWEVAPERCSGATSAGEAQRSLWI